MRGAVLFDLDGTLVDTAVELIACVDEMLGAEGRPAVPPEALRSVVSHGAAALVQQAWSPGAGTARARRLEEDLVARYRGRLGTLARPFPGIERALAALEEAGIPWGVLTNKPAWLTHPLLRALELDRRAHLVLCGDELPHAKPDPAGMHAAAAELRVPPGRCIMIGDARRDVDAAKRSGNPALVALFGYLHAGDRVTDWGADGLVSTPDDIVPWVHRLLPDVARG